MTNHFSRKTCPLILAMIKQLAGEQHFDDHRNVVHRYSTNDYFDKPTPVDAFMEEADNDGVANYEASVEFLEDHNLAEWYGLENGGRDSK